jgi:hypothetical protein
MLINYGDATNLSRVEVSLWKPSIILSGTRILQHLNISNTLCHNIHLFTQATPWKHVQFLRFHKLWHTAEGTKLTVPNFLWQSQRLAMDS